MRNRERFSAQEVKQPDPARLTYPDIARARDLARAFTDLARNCRGRPLSAWIRRPENNVVHRITVDLRYHGSFPRTAVGTKPPTRHQPLRAQQSIDKAPGRENQPGASISHPPHNNDRIKQQTPTSTSQPQTQHLLPRPTRRRQRRRIL
jgi:hypothetical protein